MHGLCGTKMDGLSPPSSETRDPSYFGYYAMLGHQQNMLQDAVRTNSYYNAVMNNRIDFEGKIVLDVGAGSGILSFFAAQAGAAKVYAVEASGMAKHARTLVKTNGLEDVVKVIEGKIEEIELPEKVDIIISEPIGVFLVHERMIESFIYARSRWLLPAGDNGDVLPSQMYPSSGTICFAPFSDVALYAETFAKAKFWEQRSFYGLNISSLYDEAVGHYFSQPVVGGFDTKILMAPPCNHQLDFNKAKMSELQDISIDFSFMFNCTGVTHGLAGWFDLTFLGSEMVLEFSTSAANERTHWHQVRFIFRDPIAVNRGQVLKGRMMMSVNDQRSYNMSVEAQLVGTKIAMKQQYLLHDQQYYYLSQSVQHPVDREFLGIY